MIDRLRIYQGRSNDKRRRKRKRRRRQRRTMQVMQVWHTKESLREMNREPGRDSPECSICYNSYDNVFKTPKLLECAHTFCLECLSRQSAMATQEDGEGEGEGWAREIQCALCRRLTSIPRSGTPSLATDRAVLSQLPAHQQQQGQVWMEATKLCYFRPPNLGRSAICICIDVGGGGDKQEGAESTEAGDEETGPLWHLERMAEWKRFLLVAALAFVMIAVVLWPLYCIVDADATCWEVRLRPTAAPLPPPTPVKLAD